MTTAPVTARTGCTGDGCGEREPWLLHHVRHRGVFCSLCTSCVLKYHLGHFCCSCFALLDSSPPSDSADRAFVHCSKCPSVSHLACLPDPGPAAADFICLSCSNPGGFSFFPFSSGAEAPGKASNEKSQRVIDDTSAKVLLLAANISAASMSKAAAVFKAEAERKVKEAAVARRRAREMLEKVISISEEEKLRANGVKALVKAMPSVPSSEPVEPKKKMPRPTAMGVATTVTTHKKAQDRESEERMRFREISLVRKPAHGAAERVKGAPGIGVGSDLHIKERVAIVPHIPKQVQFEEKKSITMAYQSKSIEGEEKQVLDVADKNSGMPQIGGDGSIPKNDPMVIAPASVNTESLP